MANGWKTAAVCCGLTIGACIMLCFICVGVLIPILQIGFGEKYLNQCPINPNIPVYLIVAGLMNIVMCLLLILMMSGAACCDMSGNTTAAGSAICADCSAIIFSIIGGIFPLIWLILGSAWVFGAKGTVQHDKPELNTYCHGTLYNFAFVIIIIQYAAILFQCMQQMCTNAARQGTTSGNARIDL